MYYEHFGLSQAPFKITPDTRLFYEGGKRGDILEALAYAILSGEGIVKVVGEVGSGKTMLSRMLEVKLPDHVDIVYFANPSLAPADVLYAIAVELKIDLSAGTDRIQALHALQQTLLQRHAEGRQVVCFVEEAQSMPLETLEEIRLLSNLETHVAKLLQIVLFGQPELDENLDEQSIRQLKERIVHSFYLDPLEKTDISSYISFRMRAVGYRGPDVFTLGAYKALEKASLGLIRRVNIIGDKALLAAYAEDSHQVTEKHVRSAIRDSEFGRDPDRKSPYRWIYAAAAVLFAVVVGWLLGGGAANLGLTGSEPASQAVAPGEGRATPGGAQSEQAAAPMATARTRQSLQTQAPAAATGMPAYQTVAPAAPAVSQVVQAVAATTQVAASTGQPLAPAVQPAAPAARVLAPAAQAVSPATQTAVFGVQAAPTTQALAPAAQARERTATAVAPEAIVQSSLPAQQQPTAQPSLQGQAQAQALPTQGFVRQIAQPARLQLPAQAVAQQAIGQAAAQVQKNRATVTPSYALPATQPQQPITQPAVASSPSIRTAQPRAYQTPILNAASTAQALQPATAAVSNQAVATQLAPAQPLVTQPILPPVGPGGAQAAAASAVRTLPQPTSAQVAPAQVAPAQVAPAQVAPAQVAPAQVAPAQVAPAQVAPAQVAPAQVAPAQVAPAQVAPAQVAPAQVAPAQVAPAQVALGQTPARVTTAQATSTPPASAQTHSAQSQSGRATSVQATSAQAGVALSVSAVTQPVQGQTLQAHTSTAPTIQTPVSSVRLASAQRSSPPVGSQATVPAATAQSVVTKSPVGQSPMTQPLFAQAIATPTSAAASGSSDTPTRTSVQPAVRQAGGMAKADPIVATNETQALILAGVLPASAGNGIGDNTTTTQSRLTPSTASPRVVEGSGGEASTQRAPANTLPKVDGAAHANSPLLFDRLRATEAWLLGANGNHFSIQLMLANESKQQNLEVFLERWQQTGHLRSLYVYRTAMRGAIWYGVLYNEYPSLQAAKAALQALPDELKRHRPFIRNIKDIGAVSTLDVGTGQPLAEGGRSPVSSTVRLSSQARA